MEYPEVHGVLSSFAGGLLVKPCLIDLAYRELGKLPAAIFSKSDHDITVPAKIVIAELSVIQAILSHK